MAKYVYSFNEGSRDMRALLGTKGANLAEMTNIGLPVPFGIIITTEACKKYVSEGTLDDSIIEEIRSHILDLEEVMNKRYGDTENPLLVSVRAGAPVSMPNTLACITNLGLNDEAAEGLAKRTGNLEFAYDCYKRLISSYGIAVEDIDEAIFSEAENEFRNRALISSENGGEYNKALVDIFKEVYKRESGCDFPQDAVKQLVGAIDAAFKSWNGEKAAEYRRANDISDALGTAVIVQSMVFGNSGENSCTGITLTRNTQSGAALISGGFMRNSQGEDLKANPDKVMDLSEMREDFPEELKRLKKISGTMESHFKDVQAFEFAVENHKLYVLQTRAAKRTAEAAVKIAVDLVNEGKIEEETAVMRIDYTEIEQLLKEESGTIREISEINGYIAKILAWADNAKSLKVRTNADTPLEAAQARAFGAEGIGLIRTEHMFSNDERLPKMRRMVLAGSEEERRAALSELLPYQKEDFKNIYKEMSDMPVTIRLLDPPLRAFLPKSDEEIRQASEQYGIPYEKVLDKTLSLQEFNPMLGHRGGRLMITYPEIAEMQTKAIITAALEVRREANFDIIPEIMIPFISNAGEFSIIKKTVKDVADRLIEEDGEGMRYLVGTMIETPRAAMTADEIAEEAEFFSFGTNDLTMMSFGLSRLDSADIIKEYSELGIFETDPFVSLDMEGVGNLIRTAVEKGKKTRPNIRLGICGVHVEDPKTIEFCHELGLNYVSCTPRLVPVARLVAAQAAISDRRNNRQ